MLGLPLLAPVASANSARAGAGASTKLTIQIWHGGVFGYVVSPEPGKCAAGRSVAVLVRQARRSMRIGTATARRRDGRYQWSIKTKSSGELFAMASKRPGCRATNSGTIPPKTNRNGVPNCPSNEAVCYFPNMHGDMVEFHICPSYSNPSGSCGGTAEGGVPPWSPTDKADFSWETPRAQRTRDVFYRAGEFLDPDANLSGSVPSSDSAAYTISNATDPHGPSDTKATRWYTPDVAGAAPGTEGGPLYLDFENGSWGFDIYIRGYLYKK